MTSDVGVRPLDIIRARLRHLHDRMGYSWRKIALLDAYKGIPAGSLCSYAKDREPKGIKHRRILDLPLTFEIPVGKSRVVVTILDDDQ